MCRLLARGVAPFLLVLLAAGRLLAQGLPAAAAPLPGDWRGPGFYLSWPKLLVVWLLFLAWVATTDWVNADAQRLRLKVLHWNGIVFGSFLAALGLFFVIPYFALGLFLLLAAYGGALGGYVYYRNSKVPAHRRVLTHSHLRFLLATLAAKVGITIATEAALSYEKGTALKLSGRCPADPRQENVRLLTARQLPGFNAARETLAQALSRRAAGVLLDFRPERVAVRHLIDGVWLDFEPLERESGDALLAALKVLCGLNPQDRRAQQEGPFAVEFETVSYTATLGSQGVASGERALVQLQSKSVRFESYDALGMRPKMQEQLQELLGRPQGLLLFSAIPGGGLRSTMNVMLRKADRIVREFAALEAENNRYEEIENITVTTYKPGTSPVDELPRMVRGDPQVLVVRDLVDAPTLSALCAASARRLVIGSVRATECVDALLRVLALKAPPAELARSITAVLNQRLVRKLCGKCREAYAPAAQALEPFGIPAGKVKALYRPRQQAEEVCPECGGVGYKGRTAIFELLVVDDALRKLLAGGAAIDALRRAARKAGLRSLQDEGIVMAAKGVTSLPELVRILKP
jgi:type II secretory ATPase GspE/PulE/Tfp pilus assembly ATPase PilB-like protein